MVKITETTHLSGSVTSFRTEIGTVDTKKTLQDRYQHYKDLLNTDGQPSITVISPKEVQSETEKQTPI
jgi:hypothetical protein